MLQKLAKRRLRSLQQAEPPKTPSTETRPTLIEWVASVWPGLDGFDYFAPYAKELETAIAANKRLCIAAPPQHGKTLFTLLAFLYWAKFFPGGRHAYVTFNQNRAHEVAKDFLRLAAEAGFDATGTLALVELGKGTTVKFTSVHGDLTGSPVDGVFVIDDPIKGLQESLSPIIRRGAIDWYKSIARARRHEGTSFIVMATRWHIDDPTGYFIKEEKWAYINLKAIAEPKHVDDIDEEGRVKSDPLHRLPGESLWKQKPPAFFREEKTDRYWWSAMYQGEPVPLGGRVFMSPGETDELGKPLGPGFYRELPATHAGGAFGLDLAYTAKTHADWSILVEGWRVVIDGRPKLLIVDVQRKQVKAPDFALILKVKNAQHPGWQMRWYASGTEKGSADFLRRSGKGELLHVLRVLPPIGDKFVRAQGAAAGWNRGDILLPDPEVFQAPWLAPFLQVVGNFTGVSDDQDDDVDALAALWDQLMHKNPMVAALERAKNPEV